MFQQISVINNMWRACVNSKLDKQSRHFRKSAVLIFYLFFWFVVLVFFAVVVKGRRGDTGWQHSHQDREPKPVCASFYQSSRGDRDTKQGNPSWLLAFSVSQFPCSLLHAVTWNQNSLQRHFSVLRFDSRIVRTWKQRDRSLKSSPVL